jgi:predicted RNA-binding protein YlqC (UPF0109 family)
MHGLRVF